MSTEDIKKAAVMAANQDTPVNVSFPSSWASVIAWLVGRVGAPAAMAITFAVYLGMNGDKCRTENHDLNQKVLEAFTARTVIESEHVSLLRTMQSTLAKIDEKLDRERRTSTP